MVQKKSAITEVTLPKIVPREEDLFIFEAYIVVFSRDEIIADATVADAERTGEESIAWTKSSRGS